MNYEQVITNWKNFSKAIENVGGEVKAFTIEEPASKNDIRSLEDKLGNSIPSSFKEVLLDFSRKVEFRWFFESDYQLENELSGIFCGERHWSLEWIHQFNQTKDGWVEACFPDPQDPYDVIWHNKFAFHEVGNGDYLAIDQAENNKEKVVYLSHDDGIGHGVELAKNFKEFLFSTSRLGCVGGEDWQMLPFIEKSNPYINANCENARKFREALNVDA